MAVKNAHQSPPAGKPQSRSQYADPQNYKWPVDAKHIRAALSYYNGGSASEGGYSPSMWGTIGRRIASAARRIIGGAYKLVDGKVQKAVAATEGDAVVLTQPNDAGLRALNVRYETPLDTLEGFTGEQLDGLLRFFASSEASVLDEHESETLDEGIVDDTLAQASLPVTHGMGAAGVSSIDPDGDGDDDTTVDGDTDGDYQRRRMGAREEFVAFDGSVAAEEVTVAGVPCFRFEAMLIPADAVSKNTVPGKKGPTYYSARRIRQYVDDNNALLEELGRSGQRVTIYPRHAAAMLDAALPLGWVERYFTRKSSRALGKEDAWYTGLIPLTTEGADARTRIRTGLVQFTSLRSMADGSFQTQPVKLNGHIVEEAIKLPIAGVDLVATQPGLPVDPIRILEEAAIEELDPAALEDSMSAPMMPGQPQRQPANAQGQVPANPPQNPQQQQQQPGPQQGGQTQVPQQYANCPNCGQDISHHIVAAHVAMQNGANNQQAAQQQQQQQPPQRSQQPMSNQQTQQPAREELEAENATLKARIQALEAEAAARSASQTGASEEALATANAKIAAMEAEISGLGELRAWKAAQELVAAKRAKIDELVASDKTLGNAMRQLIEEAAAPLTSVAEVETHYWKIRSMRIDDLLKNQSYRQAPGFGVVNLPQAGAGASEEQRTSATGAQQQSTVDPADRPAQKQYSAAQEEMRQTFARVRA